MSNDISENEIVSLIHASTQDTNLINFNLKSYNDFLQYGLSQIITQLFIMDSTVEGYQGHDSDKKCENVNIQINFSNVEVGKPQTAVDALGTIVPLFPNYARSSGQTYAGALTLSCKIKLTANYKDKTKEYLETNINSQRIANIPIMVGSCKCHTYKLPSICKTMLGEDSNEPGGYMIVKGGEWVIDLLENIKFNTLHLYKKMDKNEITRGTIISQANGGNDNSSQLICRHMENGEITLDIQAAKINKICIPFHVLFRVFGMQDDIQITEQVVSSINSESNVDKYILQQLTTAFLKKDPVYVGLYRKDFIDIMIKTSNTKYIELDTDEKYIVAHKQFMDKLDISILPHLGQSEEDRIKKLRFIGNEMIRKMLLAEQNLYPTTDRDNYRTKRIIPGGTMVSKAFKSQFNHTVAIPLKRYLEQKIKVSPFKFLTSQNIRETFNRNISGSNELTQTLEQMITSGNDVINIGRRSISNRVSSTQLERKNQANTISIMRTVNQSKGAAQMAKGTERAELLRQVHSSTIGFICPAQSPDTGEKVGIPKQLACTSTITYDIHPEVIKNKISEDKSFIPLDEKTNSEALNEKLCNIKEIVSVSRKRGPNLPQNIVICEEREKLMNSQQSSTILM